MVACHIMWMMARFLAQSCSDVLWARDSALDPHDEADTLGVLFKNM